MSINTNNKDNNKNNNNEPKDKSNFHESNKSSLFLNHRLLIDGNDDDNTTSNDQDNDSHFTNNSLDDSSSSTNDNGQHDDDDDDDDEEFQISSSSNSSHGESDDYEDEDFEEVEEEKTIIKSKVRSKNSGSSSNRSSCSKYPKRKLRRRNIGGGRPDYKENNNSSSDDVDDEDEDEEEGKPIKERNIIHDRERDGIRKSKRTKILETKKRILKMSQEDDDDESDDEYDEENKKKYQHVKQSVQSGKTTPMSNESSDTRKKKKSKVHHESDEEFKFDSNEESENEESTYTSLDKLDDNNDGVKFNDDMSFENDIEDDDVEGKEETTPSQRSSRVKLQLSPLNIRTTPRTTRSSGMKKYAQKKYESDDEYFDDDDHENGDIDEDHGYRYKSLASIPSSSSSSKAASFKTLTTPQKYCQQCTSTTDEITLEPLPPLHVCYLAPDKVTRHCFALDTLYKAAMIKGIQQYKDDGSIHLLQPPHFKTLMEDVLLDQIASRFGRKALCIEESQVYKKEKNNLFDYERNNGIFGDVDEEEVVLGESFPQRFDQYLTRAMGYGDLYVCCICYTEAKRRFCGGNLTDEDDIDDDDDDDGNNSDSKDKTVNSDNEYSLQNVTASKVDPMTILGGLDDEEYEIASSFCFKKLSLLKLHIRREHKEDTSRVLGSDLYQRFKIRAQDGLLQNHLRAYWRSRLCNNAMRLYWAEGYNQSYILLRHLIERREQMIESGIDAEVDEFCTSFPNRSKKIWSRLVGPYLHDNEKDAGDFIVDDGDESVESFQRPVFENSDSDLEEKFIQHLRKKRQASSESESYGVSSDDEDSDSQGELSIIKTDKNNDDSSIQIVDGNGERDDSSSDEWIAKKLPIKPKAKPISKPHIISSGQKRARVSNVERKKIDESDSDDDIFGNDHNAVGNAQNVVTDKPRSHRKKGYHFSSDEESNS